MYTIVLSKAALKQVPLLRQSKLLDRVNILLEVLRRNPFEYPPAYEKLVGDLSGLYSRRINIKHRLVYGVDEGLGIVHVLSMWTHYEE